MISTRNTKRDIQNESTTKRLEDIIFINRIVDKTETMDDGTSESVCSGVSIKTNEPPCNVINRILRAMKEQKSQVKTQNCGMIALESYTHDTDGTVNEANIADIIRLGGKQLIEKAMNEHLANIELSSQGCILLGSLAHSQDSDHIEKIFNHSVVHAIVQAMTSHSDSYKVQEKGCIVLAKLASKQKNYTNLIVNAGGVKVIADAMQMYGDYKVIQERGCYALGRLAYSKDISSDENEYNIVKVIKTNGLDLITMAMKKHETKASVQESGCLALGRLAYAKDQQTLAEIVNSSAVEMVIKSLFDHVVNTEVVYRGLGALITLSKCPENKRSIVRSKGVMAIIKALESHVEKYKYDDKIPEYGLWALSVLANDQKEIKGQIEEAKGIELIIAIMADHRDKYNVQKRGCVLLDRLSTHHNGRKDKMIKAIGMAMKHHERDPEVNSCALLALAKLNRAKSKRTILIVGKQNVLE